jgi:hypothetical protein
VWAAANPFVTATFRYVLAEDSAAKVTIQVRDATGKVVWSQDGPTKAGYHEVPWAASRQGRPGQAGSPQGQGGGGFPGFGRGNAGMRPGAWAVTLQCGDSKAVFPFRVHDRRGPQSVVGGVPGLVVEGEVEERTEQDQRAAAWR